MIIDSGNSPHFVSGGHTESGNIVVNGGLLEVLSGGKIVSTTDSSGGLDIVFGVASGTVISSGGSESVASGGTASGTMVNDGGEQNVFSGGTALSTTVNSVGFIDIFSGGVVSDTALNGGIETVNGTASGTVIGSGGRDAVFSGGVTINTRINNGGQETVEPGGRASGTIISSGGRQQELSGGTAIGTIVSSGGTAVVEGGLLELANAPNGGSVIFFPFQGRSELKLDGPGIFTGTITGIATADIIDLANTTVKSAVISGSALTVTQTNNALLTYQLVNPNREIRFAIAPDGAGGSNLTASNELTLREDVNGRGVSDIVFRNDSSGDT
jgi:fibronectin-binding autotransporter adhesin